MCKNITYSINIMSTKTYVYIYTYTVYINIYSIQIYIYMCVCERPLGTILFCSYFLKSSFILHSGGLLIENI